MMKILYYDCFCGISGDMNLGALIDLGVEGDYIINELQKLSISEEYEIAIRRDAKLGITGTKFDVILRTEHGHYHQHRTFRDIRAIIEASGLYEQIKKRSIDIFTRIAEAEAKVHGKPVDEVHFHEVGAVDSLIDIVGAAIALDYLQVDKVVCSTVQVGGGFVNCAHGTIPVPAPATVELLRGIPIKTGLVDFETTTPTGAAILAACADEFTDRLDFVIDRVGYGLGTRDLHVPNVLRVYLGTSEASLIVEEQVLIETNIDDMSPELYEYIEELLFDGGALDVYKTPIIMKKGRPAVKLSVLVAMPNDSQVIDILLRETTSIGIRQIGVKKTMLERSSENVATAYGEIPVKSSFYKGQRIKYKAEYENCRKIARENGVPLREVYREVDKAMDK